MNTKKAAELVKTNPEAAFDAVLATDAAASRENVVSWADGIKTARELVATDPGAAFDAVLAADDKTATDPADVAHDLLEKGMKHPAMLTITSALADVEKALKTAGTQEANMVKHGVGRTEAVNLYKSLVMPKMQELASEVSAVVKQLDQRMPRRF